MKYFIIAGERSGDLHASNLIKSLSQEDPTAEFFCWGGEMMEEAGGKLLKHYNTISFMGFAEVIANLGKIFKALKACKGDILQISPDVIILVDFAGFNMKIAKFGKAKGYKVFYYITPKIWAWNQDRAYKLKKLVDRLYVILPFEVSFFQKYNMEAHYVGNPVLDAVSSFVPDANFLLNHGIPEKPLIAILPGSRLQEVNSVLNELLLVIPHFKNYHFIVAGVKNLPEKCYENVLKQENVSLIFDQTYDLLSLAKAAVVTSGTATLETALFNVPQVVVYKANKLTYQIVKRLIRVKYISLVNLIVDKLVVKELIQDDLTSERVGEELKLLLEDADYRSGVLDAYQNMAQILGEKGASQTAAKLMMRHLK
jgi:lipid-A-disaccharide synthase